jgi:hypothetical protein
VRFSEVLRRLAEELDAATAARPAG